MPYLFDTDAIAELLRPAPSPGYLRWLEGVPRSEQFTSAVVVGELMKGAWQAPRRDHHLARIHERVLPAVTILPFDAAVARAYGQVLQQLTARGRTLSELDAQVAATAIHHGLALVTGAPARFEGLDDLRLEPVLARSRGGVAPMGSGVG
jgi:toxin FitB